MQVRNILICYASIVRVFVDCDFFFSNIIHFKFNLPKFISFVNVSNQKCKMLS